MAKTRRVGKRKSNPGFQKWRAHVAKTMKHMKSKGTYKKGDGLKKVIAEAKKSWHGAKTKKVRRHGRR